MAPKGTIPGHLRVTLGLQLGLTLGLGLRVRVDLGLDFWSPRGMTGWSIYKVCHGQSQGCPYMDAYMES